jgi:hypothetical protein
MRHLEHRFGARTADDSKRRDAALLSQRPAAVVEEGEIEPEQHSDGMDAATSRDQEAGSGAPPPQKGEAEKTGADAAGHRDLSAEHRRAAKPPQSARSHIEAMPESRPALPGPQ